MPLLQDLRALNSLHAVPVVPARGSHCARIGYAGNGRSVVEGVAVCTVAAASLVRLSSQPRGHRRCCGTGKSDHSQRSRWVPPARIRDGPRAPGHRATTAVAAAAARRGGEGSSTSSHQEWLAPWRRRRIRELAAGLDWSRCFASVLLVDSAPTPAYVRARLAQRLLDSIAEWNGLGKVVEAYACTPLREEDDSEADADEGWLWPGGRRSSQAAAEFADNVGLDDDQVDQILRKFGAGWSARLHEEDLREHDVIVALDRSAQDAAAAEMRRQGLRPEAGQLLLLSDFAWHFEVSQSAIQEGICADGSGTGFLEDRLALALRRCDLGASLQVEMASGPPAGAQSLAGAALDAPAWPRAAAAAAAGPPGEWRRLHCTLLKGIAGLAWFLVRSWEDNYCNPLHSHQDRDY